MNEVVTVLSFAVLAMLVVTAARIGTISLFVLSATYIFLSNITIGMPIRVFGVEFPWAIIVYSLVYFIVNLTCEFHGEGAAYRLAATNVCVQVILWGYVWASLIITPASSGIHSYNAMNQLFGTTKQISVAALLASVGPFLGIFIYSWLRRRWEALAVKYENSSGPAARIFKHRMLAIVIRNKVSTFAGQIVNTIVFFTVASFNSHTETSLIISVIVSSCIVKMIVAIADVPFLILAANLLTFKTASKSSSDVALSSASDSG